MLSVAKLKLSGPVWPVLNDQRRRTDSVGGTARPGRFNTTRMWPPDLTHTCCVYERKTSAPLMWIKRLKNRMGLREKKWARSFMPTLKGFLSSSLRWVWTDRRRSFSISLHSLSSKCYGGSKDRKGLSKVWHDLNISQTCRLDYYSLAYLISSHLVEHVHDLFVVALQQLITRLHVLGMQHGRHAVPQCTKHVLWAQERQSREDEGGGGEHNWKNPEQEGN